MNIFEAIEERHTIREYNGCPIEGELLAELQNLIDQINEEGNLHFQLVNGKQDAFEDFTIRYGRWNNVTNYLALVGPQSSDLDEKYGYYGEKIVLWAQMNGLKTGWVETQLKDDIEAPFSLLQGEQHVISIAIGFSELEGRAHKVKSIEQLSYIEGQVPEWFTKGMECAVLAHTAGNQQLFTIAYANESVSINTKPGFLEKVDLGIAKLHFEIGSGKDSKIWS